MRTINSVSDKDYQRAFRNLLPRMDKTKERVLRVMMGLPNYTASSDLLLRILKLSDHIVVNQAIGQLGAQVYRQIGQHPDGWKPGTFQSWTVIAEQGEKVSAGFPWKLRPRVVQALRALNFDSGITMPEEIAPSSRHWEGSQSVRFVNVFERSREARKICVEAKGSQCAVCGMSFESMYGQAVAGFIHVHHLRPIAEVTAQYEIDPIVDLIPVCPNCHAVIHLGGLTRSIEEVKKMITASRKLSPKPRARPTHRIAL